MHVVRCSSSGARVSPAQHRHGTTATPRTLQRSRIVRGGSELSLRPGTRSLISPRLGSTHIHSALPSTFAGSPTRLCKNHRVTRPLCILRI
ncbi:unnamed protein product [Lampetra fluviatilis]